MVSGPVGSGGAIGMLGGAFADPLSAAPGAVAAAGVPNGADDPDGCVASGGTFGMKRGPF